ncbi:unnamed protein product [Rhizoctonia solani]|uniref:F-box domain-containing protein n=1 Tax=Rhizoctonia solani TaxID=456999 RepID=A0A8H2ZWE6_9AGAM|nr:unnamed protein product [Rhizoctonia solani]
MNMRLKPVDVVPRELLVRTLHYCDYVTIIRFSLTCRRAYETVSSSVSLQLHIELEINGLEIADGSSNRNSNYSLSLKELRDYQDAWHNMRFSPMVQQPIGDQDTEVPNWELRNGVYYGDFRVSEPDHEDDFRVDRIRIINLGSSDIPPPINFEKKFNLCAVDPNQDLVILIEDEQEGSEFAYFHLHSSTTGQPHPLAEHSTITIRFDSAFLRENDLSDEAMSVFPEVMGNYFLVQIYWPESDCMISEILLWHWRTSILLARIYSEHDTARCTFLDKSHLLVYSTLSENGLDSSRLALLVYRIPSITDNHQVPPNANFRPSLYPKHSPILIFEFPELHPSWTITRQHFLLHSEPFPGDVVYTKSSTFLCSNATTLSLTFRIWKNPARQAYVYGSRKGSPTDHHVFVSVHHLLFHLTGGQYENGVTRTIPWSQWGTAATRWFTEDDSIEHMTDRIYMSKYVRSTTVRSGNAQLLSIIDFNAPVIKRRAYISGTTSRTRRTAADKAEKTAVLEGKGLTAGRLFQPRISSAKIPIPTLGQPLNHEIFTEMVGSDMETIIQTGFREPVVSCLSYRAVTKAQRMPLHGHWRMIGEYLVGIILQLEPSMIEGCLSIVVAGVVIAVSGSDSFHATVSETPTLKSDHHTTYDLLSLEQVCHYFSYGHDGSSKVDSLPERGYHLHTTLLQLPIYPNILYDAYKIVRQSISLQLHIELEVNGLEIANINRSSNFGADYTSVLEELKDCRSAWLKFRLGPGSLKQLGKSGYHLQRELKNETYFGTFRQPVHEGGEDDDDDVDNHPPDHIQVSNLNSLVSPPPLKFNRICEFAVDSKQDLIVVVEYDTGHESINRFTPTFKRAYLHLHHITTGTPHSLARFPVLTVQLVDASREPPLDFVHAFPVIMGDFLVVYFQAQVLSWMRFNHDDILIWNWRSGTLLGRINHGTKCAKPVFF